MLDAISSKSMKAMRQIANDKKAIVQHKGEKSIKIIEIALHYTKMTGLCTVHKIFEALLVQILTSTVDGAKYGTIL